DQRFRLCVGQDMPDLGWREPNVQRDRDHAEPGTRMNELDVVGFVRQQQGQSIANAEAACLQIRRDAPDALVQLTIRRPPTCPSKRRSLGIEASAPAKRMRVNHPTRSSNRTSSASGIL